jgi:hypothetical protein
MSNDILNPLKYDVIFKITNKLKFNNNHLKFNINFKSYIIFRRTPKELLYHYSLSIHLENRMRSNFLS